MSEMVKTRNNCRLCGSGAIDCSIRLSPVPIVSPNVSVADKADGKVLQNTMAPLDNYLCRDCGFNQLIHIVDPTLIYKNYLYETKISQGLDQHFIGVQKLIAEKLSLKAGDKIVEFGSNDGTLLSFFKKGGMDVQGIDPSDKPSEAARQKGVPTITDFFSQKLARQVKNDFGAAKVVISNNTMANIDNLKDIFSGVFDLLADDGVFIFETQYALDVLEKNLLDVIYHEHLSYFSVAPLRKSLGQYGLELFHADCIPTKGGSIRFWIQKQCGPRAIDKSVETLSALEKEKGLYDLARHKAYQDSVHDLKDSIHAMIESYRKKDGKVAAYGTSVGCVALIHQFELQDKLDYIFDGNPTKKTIEGPGYKLPVKGPNDLEALQPDVVIVLAWRYAGIIGHKHPDYFARGGKFFVPLPDGHILEEISERAAIAAAC